PTIPREGATARPRRGRAGGRCGPGGSRVDRGARTGAQVARCLRAEHGVTDGWAYGARARLFRDRNRRVTALARGSKRSRACPPLTRIPSARATRARRDQRPALLGADDEGDAGEVDGSRVVGEELGER